MRIWSLISLLAALMLSAAHDPLATAKAGGDCGAAPVGSLPVTIKSSTTQATTDTITFYPPSGSNAAYGGAENIYRLELAAGNRVGFTLSGQAGVTDLALFLVTTCDNGFSTVAFSQDSVDDTEPEVIVPRSYPPGTYYLLVDAFSDAPGYPRPGQYTLMISGILRSTPPLWIPLIISSADNGR